MSSFNWKSALGTIAPMIGAAVTGGSPFGAMAVNLALDALGITPERGDEEQQIAQAMKNLTPEQVVALRMGEKQWLAKMRELDIREEDLAVSNTKDARLMAREKGMMPQVILSAVFLSGYLVILGLIATGHVDVGESMKEVFILLLGLLVREIPTVMQFWFGSSAGSKGKSVDLANMVK